METLLVVLVVVLLMFVAFDVVTYFSTRKMFRDSWASNKLDEKFIVENIIYARAGLRGIYSGIVIVTTVLALMGIKEVGDIKSAVSKEVTGKIEEANKVPLDSLRWKATNVSSIETEAKTRLKDLRAISDEARNVYEKVKQAPQKLFVVESLFVKQGTTTVSFAELRPVGGITIPRLKEPPVVWIASASKDGVSYGIGTKDTKDYIEIRADGDEFATLCIYIK
jgi:hypothetical protein